MSEYQYYEFLALDRRLGREEMAEVRSVSSRAEITPASFVNEYNYGDFKGDEDDFLERFYDLHVYVANWGTHRFMLRAPKALLAREEIEPYCDDEVFTVRDAGDWLILDFTSHDEDDADWEDGSEWMHSIAPVREELLRGDRRALYLGWLLRVQHGELEEDAVEPPVPPGLGELSAALESLADFLRVDEDLIAVAAERSEAAAGGAPDDGLAEWISALPAEEKDRLLLDAATAKDGASVGAKVLARFRAERRATGAASSSAGEDPPGRTPSELLEAADRHQEVREEEEKRRRAIERAEKKAAAAKIRAKYLDELAGRQEAAWARVESLIEEKQAKPYEQAVSLLVDLRDVAKREEASDRFHKRFAALLERYSRSRALLGRMERAGLLSR